MPCKDYLSTSKDYKHSNIHIVAHPRYLHIAGSINQTLQYVTTKYIYIVEHDFPFCRAVNHPAIIRGMEEHPHLLPIARFDSGLHPQCAAPINCSATGQHTNTSTEDQQPMFLQTQSENAHYRFYKSACWSNNNHVATVQYYKEMLHFIKDHNHYNLKNFLRHATEWLLIMHTSVNCTWTQYVYDGQEHLGQALFENTGLGHHHICHLDGRDAYNDTTIKGGGTIDLDCIMDRTCRNMTTHRL
jgi:hypothetical protein